MADGKATSEPKQSKSGGQSSYSQGLDFALQPGSFELDEHTIQRVDVDPKQLRPQDVLALQRVVGNKTVMRLLGRDQATQPPDVQRTAPVGPEGGRIDDDVAHQIHRGQSGGSTLPNSVRAPLESQLQADLGRVKVHTDSHAVQLNRTLGAKAFTHKHHIYYGAGQSPRDLRLTAHEAVHTIQQGAVAQRMPVSRLPQLEDGNKPIQRSPLDLFTKPKKSTTPQTGEVPVETDPPTTDVSDTTDLQSSTDVSSPPKPTGQAPPFLYLDLAVKTNSEARGSLSLREALGAVSGHSWIELQLGPQYADMDAMEADPNAAGVLDELDVRTRALIQLDRNRKTSFGFYPAVNHFSASNMLRQIYSKLPGEVEHPERPVFAGRGAGVKRYPITSVKQTQDLFRYIYANWRAGYHFLVNNCTHWAMNAIKAVGFTPPKNT